MSRFEVLKKLMLKHRYQLVLTYLLFALEMTGSLLRPFFLGMAINDLLKNSYDGLIYLSIVHLVYLIAGQGRGRNASESGARVAESLRKTRQTRESATDRRRMRG